MTYFNTTHLTGKILTDFRRKAKNQEEKILAEFLLFPWMEVSPSKIQELVFPTNWPPITSVRRALTNLTKAGDLIKTEKQTNGRYGRPEYKWRLADQHKQQNFNF